MPQKPSKTVPFTIRLTPAEKAVLERLAGRRPVSTYAREILLGQEVSENPKRPEKRASAPKIDETALAQILGLLGKSEWERALRQMGNAARMGALPLAPEVLERIDKACADIAAIKSMLMKALRIKEN